MFLLFYFWWWQRGKKEKSSHVRLFASPWKYPGKNTGVSSLSLLQETFPSQGSNSGLSHCRWILYQLSHKGSPRLEWVAYPFSSGSPDTGIELGSPALQVGSLPTELSREALLLALLNLIKILSFFFFLPSVTYFIFVINLCLYVELLQFCGVRSFFFLKFILFFKIYYNFFLHLFLVCFSYYTFPLAVNL